MELLNDFTSKLRKSATMGDRTEFDYDYDYDFDYDSDLLGVDKSW